MYTMTANLPVMLQGPNLVERHKSFNSVVKTALQNKLQLKSIIQLEEKSPLDRIFKIDLASKYKDVEYIIQNLKDDDMLYVSRALKCHWLLEPEYCGVMNPRHLEEDVFPHMIQPAVNKTRHWIQLHLTDPARCQDFYEYYKGRHEIAIKFLWHCPQDYILSEFSNVLNKLTPQDFKILCESCPQVAEKYFDGLKTNKEALSHYLKNEISYFKSLRCILKLNASMYLDILEKHFNLFHFEPLSPMATRYIMKNYKHRFNAKQELYTAYILHLKTLAKFITADEAKQLVLKLAKAKYLESWFSFQKVEPIIKRLAVHDQAAFKKKIFVDKDIGDQVKDWEYPIPKTFEVDTTDKRNIFLDEQDSPRDYELCDYIPYRGENVKCCAMRGNHVIWKKKTALETLFDEYRFQGFETTFRELTKKLLIEDTNEVRMNIFLVLVSKSAGVQDHVKKLLKFLVEKHINEPCHVRAAIVRSLVKRACVWRLSADLWDMLLEFGRDLGLEGDHAELVCREGLHAAVLRCLINDLPLSTALNTAFFNEMSTLKEYKLTNEEILLVGKRLAKILLDNKPYNFLNVLAEYKIKIDDIPDAEMTLVQMARSDVDLARLLFERRIGRRHLLKETFKFRKNDESFMTALKHDTSILVHGEVFAELVTSEKPRHDRFLRSLALYFNEANGLVDQHRASLINSMKLKPRAWFALPINILSINVSFRDLLKELNDMDIPKRSKSQLDAALRATACKRRPALDITSVDWRWIGVKAVANKVLICRAEERASYIQLLMQWKRTARLAIRLALKTKSSTETFITVSQMRPGVALKIAKSDYLKNSTVDPVIWEATKSLIKNLDSTKTSKYVLDRLTKGDVPEGIKAEYWAEIYKMLLKIDKQKAIPVLCRLEELLPSVNKEVIKLGIDQFLQELNFNKFEDDYVRNAKSLYLRILGKYLLTCTSQAEQRERLDNVCDVFFDKLEVLKSKLKSDENESHLYETLQPFIRALKYNKVFLGNFVSSLAVFERVLRRMKKLLPIEQYFSLYVEVHLIMLYSKSLKQGIKQKPNVFENLEQNLEEAIEVMGLQLGQNIGAEVKELVAQYYFSIIDIYKDVLLEFLENFKSYESHEVLIPVLNGLVMFGQTESLLLALHIVKSKEYIIPKTYKEKILKDLKAVNDDTLKFFLYNN